MKFYKTTLTGKNIFLSVIFFIAVLTSFSQNYHFDNYIVKEGLAQSSVYAITQDQNGFIWMGTEIGRAHV